MAAVDRSPRTPPHSLGAVAANRSMNESAGRRVDKTTERAPGGPLRVVLTVAEMRSVHGERDATRLLLTAFGWDGSLADWLEMLARMEGVGGATEHFRTTTPQLFLLELEGTDGGQAPIEVGVLSAVRTVNRKWRDRTGRSLIGVLPS